jgi:hypothetical protein
MMSEVLREFILQPKSAIYWNKGIFKNQIKNLGSLRLTEKNKNIRLCDLNWGSESRNMYYIYMFVNSVANSVWALVMHIEYYKR